MKSLRDPFLLTLRTLCDTADERARCLAERQRAEGRHGTLRSDVAVPSRSVLQTTIRKRLAPIEPS